MLCIYLKCMCYISQVQSVPPHEVLWFTFQNMLKYFSLTTLESPSPDWMMTGGGSMRGLELTMSSEVNAPLFLDQLRSMSGNPTCGWKYYHLVGNPSNLVGNPSTVVGNLTAKLPGNPTGGWKFFHQCGWISYHLGGISIHPGWNLIQPGWKFINQTLKKSVWVRPSLYYWIFHKKARMKKNLANSNICFIKGSGAKLRLLKNTFKPLVVEISTTLTAKK